MAGLIDAVVEAWAKLVDALGGNGARVRWRWRQRRSAAAPREDGGAAAGARHRMCPSCRALVPRSARTCTECGTSFRSAAAVRSGGRLGGLLPSLGSATSLILLANGLWFALSLVVLARSGAGGLGSVLMFPGEFNETLVRFGALWMPWVLALGQWWRLITAVFLHGGLIHFFFNTYVFVQLAPLVEEEYDTARMWIVYIVSGALGFATTCAWQLLRGRPAPSLGASGAILGLMGVLLAYGMRRGGGVGARVRSLMTQYILYIFLVGLLFRGIDHAAHLGGVLSGFALGWAIPYGPLRSAHARRAWEALAWALLAVVVVAFLLAGRSYAAGGA